jgi:very-short-patch-repair endonuclease
MGVKSLTTSRRISEKTTSNARALRGDMTDVERILWHAIRRKQIPDCRFRRQHPIGQYIADFACIDKRCVIELDGGQHQVQLAYDEKRTAYMQSQGWRVLRFWNNEVVENLNGVLAKISEVLSTQPPSQPPPVMWKERVCRALWSK